eukprot:10011197-Heterocapsa_arctica.AAC.1
MPNTTAFNHSSVERASTNTDPRARRIRGVDKLRPGQVKTGLQVNADRIHNPTFITTRRPQSGRCQILVRDASGQGAHHRQAGA